MLQAQHNAITVLNINERAFQTETILLNFCQFSYLSKAWKLYECSPLWILLFDLEEISFEAKIKPIYPVIWYVHVTVYAK